MSIPRKAFYENKHGHKFHLFLSLTITFCHFALTVFFTLFSFLYIFLGSSQCTFNVMMKIVIKQWEQFTDEARSNWECKTCCWVYFDLISFHSLLGIVSHCKMSLTKDVHCRYEQDMDASDKEQHQKEECFRHRKLRYWNEIAGNGFLISFFKRLDSHSWK